MRELSGYLGSSDPELRDDLAYTLIDAWVAYQQQLTAPELITLLEEWQPNLLTGLGQINNDTVLGRSFSALCLSVLAERELKKPFLGEPRYRSLLASALAYLQNERDLRSFDPTIGWIHATAHTADLLAFLSANPLLKIEDQARILQAISARLASAHEIFGYGEQDRLAHAIANLAARKDFDEPGFHKWLTSLDDADRNTWKTSPPDLHLLQTFMNNTYMLRALAVYLYPQAKNPVISTALDAVTQVLGKR